MNITIYIRSSIEDRFREEPDKSKLINELLQQHYGIEGPVNIKENADGTISPRTPGATSSFTTNTWQEVKTKSPADILTEIKGLELARDEELEFVQDDREVAKIGKQYQEEINKLWAQYHSMKPKQ